MKNAINAANINNLTINQNISIGAGNGGNPGKSVPEDIKLSDLLSLLGNVNRAETTPTPKALREKKLENGTIESIAPFVETLDGTCKVYANGYAVYSNEIGTTVLWLPDCVSFTYQFDELKDAEKDYFPQRSEIGEDVMGSQPWFIAVMLKGDHRVERNSMNRTGGRRDGNQNLSLDEVTQREEQGNGWRPGCRFENPEAAYIRKEMMEEQLSRLTDKQRAVFLLYHREGYNQKEIAELLGISQQAVDYRLAGAESKVRMNAIRFF